MPTMPVKAAGWRMEPPVSEAVAARQRSAATAVADPPDDPPEVSCAFEFCAAPRIGRRAEARCAVVRAHGELVHVELAEHDRALVPQVLRDGALIGRRELAEDVGAGGGAYALGAEQVLDAEGRAFELAALALGQLRVGGFRHVHRLVGCDDDIGVEGGVRLVDLRQEGLRDFLRRERLGLQAIDGVGKGQLGQVGHLCAAFSCCWRKRRGACRGHRRRRVRGRGRARYPVAVRRRIG